MIIYIDCETLRAPEETRLQILEDTKSNFKAPSTLSKAQAAIDLGLTDAKEIKFISKDDMITRWEKELARSKSGDVAQAQWEKTSFNPDAAPIACIVIGWFNDGEYQSAVFEQNEVNNEADMLDEFHFAVNNLCAKNGAQISKPMFVGHNIAKFDLPFIWKRSVINNVACCEGVKWVDSRHGSSCFDTMLSWSGFGGRISADNLCKLLGIKGKTEGMDGSLVYDTWQTDPQKVINYCIDDVTLVKELHARLTK